MGKVWDIDDKGLFVFEGTAPRSRIHHYNYDELTNCVIYRVTDHEITSQFKALMIRRYLHKRYDVSVYFRTAIQYIVLRVIERIQHIVCPYHKFTMSLPRVLNDRYTCWELVEAIDRDAGIDWCPRSRYPMITDFLDYTGEL
jgi:hypothetical protein